MWYWWCISVSISWFRSSQRKHGDIAGNATRDKGDQHFGQVKKGEHPACLVWAVCTVSFEGLPLGAAPWDLQSDKCSMQADTWLPNTLYQTEDAFPKTEGISQEVFKGV